MLETSNAELKTGFFLPNPGVKFTDIIIRHNYEYI